MKLLYKVVEKAMIYNWFNRIPHPAFETRREKYKRTVFSIKQHK